MFGRPGTRPGAVDIFAGVRSLVKSIVQEHQIKSCSSLFAGLQDRRLPSTVMASASPTCGRKGCTAAPLRSGEPRHIGRAYDRRGLISSPLPRSGTQNVLFCSVDHDRIPKDRAPDMGPHTRRNTDLMVEGNFSVHLPTPTQLALCWYKAASMAGSVGRVDGGRHRTTATSTGVTMVERASNGVQPMSAACSAMIPFQPRCKGTASTFTLTA